MATMITNECINCGACEPECPNNAISQGEAIFVIDPLLCTECVGFHDHEACAAVCPVDCCVTDPNNIESEETLIARARSLHKDVDFGENFQSRFQKNNLAAEAKPATPAAAPEPAAVSKPPEPKTVEAAAKPAGAAAVVAAAVAPKPVPTAPPTVKKEIRPKKAFANELPVDFEEISERYQASPSLSRGPIRILIFLLQPVLGALPHKTKKSLEAAVGNPIIFSASGSTGLNILHNVLLYAVLAMGLAAIFKGPGVVFTQEINLFVLAGIVFGAAEGIVRLRDGIFHVKPADEMRFPAALYGAPLGIAVQPLLAKHAGLMRDVPVPVDGFYSRGFVEKRERERRYGNVYTIEDRGGAYLLRLEFPRRVPDLGLAAQAQVADEMPDYDYDLVLKDSQFIVKGKCTDDRIRKISSSIGAFPPEFTTTISLPEKIHGFVHRMQNKLLEVFLMKENGRLGSQYH